MSFLVRGLGVLTFRLRRRAPRRLRAFDCAELGSMIDLRLAAAACEDPERSAAYLAHADDEARHARMFARHAARWARELEQPPPPPVEADTEQLFDRLGEEGFLAFVHRGERRGRREFEVYRDWFAARRAPTAALFDAIVEDERRHERTTGALLEALSDRPRRALRRAALWEAWRTYRRAGRALAALLYRAAMLLLYLACAPLALLVGVARPPRAGWLEGPER
jgi:hypothetical protein